MHLAAVPHSSESAMTYLLPPLNALRACKAAARRLSCRQAAHQLHAHQLHATPGAVSQQVRPLEDRLGVQLFKRLTRQMILTSAGETYLTSVRQAFRRPSLLHIDVHASLDIEEITVNYGDSAFN